MSDLGAVCNAGHSGGERVAPVWPNQRTDGPPAGDAYGVETMSRFRRHARAEYGHGAGQSRAAILRNAPHQKQCELNDAELEVVVGGEMDVQGAADQMIKQQSENRLEQLQNALQLFRR